MRVATCVVSNSHSQEEGGVGTDCRTTHTFQCNLNMQLCCFISYCAIHNGI